MSNESPAAPTPSPTRRLRRLAERVFEAPDLEGLTELLTRELRDALGVEFLTLLLWDRKLDSFQTLTPGETRREGARSDPGHAPSARYLLSEGELLDTGAEGGATLVPLLARSGLIGMVVIGPRADRRVPPFSRGEVRQVSALTQRAALALENHLYQREMIASERLTALGTMAGMLAHDFRGPMTVIRGYAELMQDETLPRDEVVSRARLITEMVDRLERMTTETLDFARGAGRLARRSLGLSRMLHTFAADLAEELPGLEIVRDIRIDADAKGSLDVDKLRRTVSNIAANARDAMGGRGRFHIVARIEERSPAEGEPPRAELSLELRDEGPGVSPEIRDRVFDPFVTQGKKGGTGLGLAVARRFIEDHGGSLELLPEGPGARFRIRLPLEPPASPAAA